MDGPGIKGADALNKRLTAIQPTRGLSREMLGSWQIHTVQYAKETVARKTAILAGSIHPGSLGDFRAQVDASASYALYVEKGTKPHIIRPRFAKVLAWGGSTRLTGSVRSSSAPTRFARLVHHPGTKAQPFLEPAGQKALAQLELAGMITLAWDEAA